MNTRAELDNCLLAFKATLAKISTGKADPHLLAEIVVPYYGTDTPLNQVAQVSVKDQHTLSIVPWESNMSTEIKEAISQSDLNLDSLIIENAIYVTVPPLSYEARGKHVLQAEAEAEKTENAMDSISHNAAEKIRSLLHNNEAEENAMRNADKTIREDRMRFRENTEKALADKVTKLREI